MKAWIKRFLRSVSIAIFALEALVVPIILFGAYITDPAQIGQGELLVIAICLIGLPGLLLLGRQEDMVHDLADEIALIRHPKGNYEELVAALLSNAVQYRLTIRQYIAAKSEAESLNHAVKTLDEEREKILQELSPGKVKKTE